MHKDVEQFPSYRVHHLAVIPELSGRWNSLDWHGIPSLSVSHFHPQSSAHHPIVNARLAYDAKMLHGIFRVKDRYVVCRHTAYQDPVCGDSCVEFFVQPRPEKGYFNFEFNCGGAFLVYYVEDNTPVQKPDGTTEFRRFVKIPWELGSLVRIAHSQPQMVDPEEEGPITWTLEFQIPFSLLETYCGALGDPHGQTWRANFYKCADNSSHPHWASWSPIGDRLSFHQPSVFGFLNFS